MLRQDYIAGIAKRWFLFKCENTLEEQVSNESAAEQQCICVQDQHQNFESTLQTQYQKKTDEIKKLKEKYKSAKEKQMQIVRIYNELKVKHIKEPKSSPQLQKVIDRLNHAKQA